MKLQHRCFKLDRPGDGKFGLGCRVDGRNRPLPGVLLAIIFLGVPCRNRRSQAVIGVRSSTRPSFDEAGESPARGELRLRVLNSLPRTPHQQYLAEEIRKLCTYYLRNKGVSASEVTPEELLSEIWKKMLGSVFLSNEESLSIPDPSQWSVDPHSPERDGRVVWLIREIGGAGALAHRHQDILRQRFGRKYQFVQTSDDEDDPFEKSREIAD